jgi:hypothetical protein
MTLPIQTVDSPVTQTARVSNPRVRSGSPSMITKTKNFHHDMTAYAPIVVPESDDPNNGVSDPGSDGLDGEAGMGNSRPSDVEVEEEAGDDEGEDECVDLPKEATRTDCQR